MPARPTVRRRLSWRRVGAVALAAAVLLAGDAAVAGSARPAAADTAGVAGDTSTSGPAAASSPSSTDTSTPSSTDTSTTDTTTTTAPPAPPPYNGPPPAVPAQGALFGAHVETGSSESAQKSGVTALESAIGRKLAIDHYYRPWTTTFPTTREQWDFDNGRIPMISWAKTYADQIVSGSQDDLIRQRADAIAALGKPLLIRWFWEMDGTRNQQYSESPALYIAAWQHIVSIFRAEGASNVGWVWCPNAFNFDDGTSQQYYPGDDWVDWTCADGYDWYLKAGDSDPSFKTVFKSFYNWAVTVPKPIMVGEYGVLEAGPADRKANWFNATRTSLKFDDPAIRAVVYFNHDGYDDKGIWRDWTVDSSDLSLNAFSLMGADPYFNGGPPAPTPDTTLATGSGPNGTVRVTSASFSFAVSPADPAATLACQVDSAAWRACTSPFSLTGLADGPHTFSVRATNAGGTDPTAAGRTWTVDTTGPTVTGTDPADAATGAARTVTPAVTFSEAVDPATVSASTVGLTGPGGAAVAGTVGYSAATQTVTITPSVRLAFNTTYTVTVKGGPAGVADLVGNRMAADRSWRFTTLPPPPAPDTFLDRGPADPAASAAATFSFSSDQAGAAFQCQLDGGAFADCVSPFTATGLADGTHTFAVRAWTIDGGSDGSPAGTSWRVDTTAPAVSAVNPAGGAAGVALAATVAVTFSEAVNPATVSAATVALQRTGDGAAVAATVAYDQAGRTATLTPAAALQPATAYTVRVTGGSAGVADLAGNRLAADRVSGFSTWAPVPDTILDPSGPMGTVTVTGATFTFSSDQPDAGFTCQLDGGTAADCTSPWSPVGPLADGPHTAVITAWTLYGGGDGDPATRTWTIDTTPPAVTAVTPANGATAAATAVRAAFSEPVAPASLSATTYTLADATGAAVAATVTWDAASRSAVLTPAAALAAGAAFTATVRGGPGGVTDPAGNPLPADKVWTFTTPVAAPRTTTFTAGADARVEKGSPGQNFGSSSTLAVDPGKASYVRFNVTGLSGTVQTARLRLYVTGGTVDGPAVFRTSSSWIEKGTGSITWNTRPAAIGAALDDKGKVAASTWVEFTVTAAVTGNGSVSFVLQGPAKDAFAAASREKSSGKAPQLVVTTR